tara:strand:+ start:1025 stop:1579 length:555 start_codon:yes stop_codon:yes gene_type:complete
MKNVTVADLMDRNPIIVGPETNLIECARKVVKKKVKIVFIVKEGAFLGVVSQYDILWALVKKSKEDLTEIKAIDLSPKKIVSLRPDMKLDKAMEKIKKSKFYRYPVVEDEKVKGIITVRDFLRFNPDYYPELEEIAKIKDEEKSLERIEKEKLGRSGREGICEECGNQDILVKHNGMLVCENCV